MDFSSYNLIYLSQLPSSRIVSEMTYIVLLGTLNLLTNSPVNYVVNYSFQDNRFLSQFPPSRVLSICIVVYGSLFFTQDFLFVAIYLEVDQLRYLLGHLITHSTFRSVPLSGRDICKG